MLEKAAEKLLVGEGHQAAFAVMSIILPSKRHVSIGHIDKSMVGDGDAVGVASQIMQHVFRSAKWLLRIDDPVLAEQRAQKSGEFLLLIQRLAGSEESNLMPLEGAFQPRHELSTKYAAEYLDWQEEDVTTIMQFSRSGL